MKEKKHDKWYYLSVLFVLTTGSFLVIGIIPLIHSIVIGFNAVLSYATIMLGGLAAGYLCCHTIDRITHDEKKELLAGIVIPLPTMIMLYGLSRFIIEVNMTLDAIGQKSIFGDMMINPILFAVIYFICFNVPFLYYFYEKHEDKRILVYYVIAPVVFVTAMVVINVLLEFV